MTMLKCESGSVNTRITCGMHPSRKYPKPYTKLFWVTSVMAQKVTGLNPQPLAHPSGISSSASYFL